MTNQAPPTLHELLLVPGVLISERGEAFRRVTDAGRSRREQVALCRRAHADSFLNKRLQRTLQLVGEMSIEDACSKQVATCQATWLGWKNFDEVDSRRRYMERLRSAPVRPTFRGNTDRALGQAWPEDGLEGQWLAAVGDVEANWLLLHDDRSPLPGGATIFVGHVPSILNGIRLGILGTKSAPSNM